MAKIDDLLSAIQNQSLSLSQINSNIIVLSSRVASGSGLGTGAGNMGYAGLFGTGASSVPLTTMASLQTAGSTAAAVGYSQTPFGGMGNLLQGLGSISDMMGPAGPVAGALFKFAGSLLKSVDAITTWTRHMMDSQMELGKFSPSMMGIKAGQDIKDVMFQMRMGEKLANSTGELANAFNRFRDETFELNTQWQIFLNTVGVKALELLEKIAFFMETGRNLSKTEAWKNRYKANPMELGAEKFWNQSADPFDPSNNQANFYDKALEEVTGDAPAKAHARTGRKAGRAFGAGMGFWQGLYDEL